MPWEKQFDVDEALIRARDVFWSQGYEATSMTALLKAMGIQKGSFYATYGSKKAVYLRALERYHEESIATLRAKLESFPPKRALETLITSVLSDCTGPERRRGCMIANCAIEQAHDDKDAAAITQRSMRAYEALVEQLLRAGQADGDLPAELDPRERSKALMAIIVGMRVYARSGSPKSVLTTIAGQALALLH